MRRYWVKGNDDAVVVRNHFATEHTAEMVAEALEEEAGGSYHVDDKP